MNEKVAHWNAVYDAREEEYLTWYETQPTLSYQLITQDLKLGETFIDVGGGASKLISILHAAGYGRWIQLVAATHCENFSAGV
ncbi:hypothetical protein [Pseudovibrio sp. Ad37]|uniref:hypothetical protein n=1 Tax=Pseudovibrio sp. Ad37 TaxID=989422 RepID=UPI0007B2311D|nr:hypothetical protein [Pseudovibrio sp. Ad37]KZL26381.1 hypothetical protein PsAD37_01820 [Pseudovibrio sp. Ad37]